MSKISYIPLFFTIIFTVFSQIIIKWQVNVYHKSDLDNHYLFLFQLLLNPWILLSILFTFFAGICWMYTMSKFEISYAFPFMSLNYILVLFLGYFLFGETITTEKIIGSFLIIIGVITIFRGSANV